jgi:hypothetical protein
MDISASGSYPATTTTTDDGRPMSVQAHSGRVVALAKFREAVAGEIKPRSVMILVEWRSKEAFDEYCNDAKIADLHHTARRVPAITSGIYSMSLKT